MLTLVVMAPSVTNSQNKKQSESIVLFFLTVFPAGLLLIVCPIFFMSFCTILLNILPDHSQFEVQLKLRGISQVTPRESSFDFV